MRDLLLDGEWKVEMPKPSPVPWSWRKHRNLDPRSRDGYETVWVILDANGKSVAEVDRQVDAELIVRAANAAQD